MDEQRVQAPETVGVVVGANLRELRKSRRWTQDAAAERISKAGLTWKRTHIADLESGRRESVDLGTLVILASVFDVRLPDFMNGQGDVLLTPRADYPRRETTSTRQQLRSWLSGGEESLLISDAESVRTALRDEGSAIGADVALAKRLGLPALDVVDAARGLWLRTLTEERDRRVAELGDLPLGERQAKQGHITRELNAELTKWINEGESGDG
ncbi:helix-turn-helix transcriptional regulator [Streptomyces virginiae]|uniref:helix-turn-helix domain-containing protein n=1 Tax=Streptomyces virginiae TaxID=1961 RepID=UPI003330208B